MNYAETKTNLRSERSLQWTRQVVSAGTEHWCCTVQLPQVQNNRRRVRRLLLGTELITWLTLMTGSTSQCLEVAVDWHELMTPQSQQRRRSALWREYRGKEGRLRRCMEL